MNLFKDFKTVSSKEWKQKIQMDLKGADYNKTLISHTNDDINIKPFYHKDKVRKLNIPLTKTDFDTCQTVFIADEKIANKIAKNALKKGASTIYFNAIKVFDVDLVLEGLEKKSKLIFKLDFLDTNFIEILSKKTRHLNTNIVIDIIDNLAKTGNWFQDKTTDFKNYKAITKQTNCIGVDASIYQNAGANNVQQIAYALAHLNEYLNEGLVANNDTVNCTFSVGSNYFFEIAKLRAFRYLFKKLVAEYKIKPNLNLIVKPTLRNKTIYDYNSNMLRTTTECMSAILGGANVINTISYDSLYHKSNDFGKRIARNQLIILREESYFKEASTIANGSYYIEQITYELAEKALNLFKDIEKNKGFLFQLISGTIQRKIKESAEKEQLQFNKNEIVLVGTNKFTNADDLMKDELELFPFVKQQPRKTIIKPIIPNRLAEKLEQERLKSEK